jgi:hypothetical protein
MSFLLAGVFAFSVGLVATGYLLTTGRTAVATWWSVAGLAIGLTVMIAGTHSLGGIVAACAGVLIGYAVTTIGAVGATLLPASAGPREPTVALA